MKKISNLAKKIDGIARFFKGVLIFAGVLLVILFLIMLGFEDSFYVDGDFIVTLDFVSFECIEVCMPDVETMKLYYTGMMIMGIAVFAFCYYEIAIIRRIIKPMIEERPFDHLVVKNIRLLAWVILIGDGVWSVIHFALTVFQYYAFDFENLFIGDKIASVSADFDFDLTFVWLFLVVYLLSYVFEYGQELQIQADETL